MSIAEQLAEEFQIWDATGDLTTFMEAYGSMWGQVELFAEDTDAYVGWSILWDVDRIPTYGLPWLAQVVGERIPTGMPDASARGLIRATPNQYRGTPAAIIAAVKACLTGNKRLWFRERFNGSEEDEDAISVATYASETPSEHAVLAALKRTVPADIAAHYEYLHGATWAALETPAKSWHTLEVDYGPSWAHISGSIPGSFFE